MHVRIVPLASSNHGFKEETWSLMLPMCTHLLENQPRREDLQGRIIIFYRLACNKGQQDTLVLSFPNGMSGVETETQQLAGEFQSLWGLSPLDCF